MTDNASTGSSITIDLGAADSDRAFLRKISQDHKQYTSKVAFYSRLTYGIETPILVLSSVNVSALVSTFFTDASLQVIGKAISIALTTISLIMLGLKKMMNPEQKREKCLHIRNRLERIKLSLSDAIAKKNTDVIEKLKAEAMDILGSLDE